MSAFGPLELAQQLALQLATRGAPYLRLHMLLELSEPEVKRQIMEELGLHPYYESFDEFYSRIERVFLNPVTNLLRPQKQLDMFASLGMSDWVEDALEKGAACSADAFIKAVRHDHLGIGRRLAQCLSVPQLEEAIRRAFNAGRLDVVQLLLRNNSGQLSNFYVEWILKEAVAYNELGLLELVLERTPLSTMALNGAASRAIRGGHLDALDLLLDAGASVDVTLYNAAAFGSVEAADFILDRSPTPAGQAEALSVARRMNHRQVAELIDAELNWSSEIRSRSSDDRDYFDDQDFLEAADDFRSGPSSSDSSPGLEAELENLRL